MVKYARADDGAPLGLAGILFDKDGTLLDFSLTWERAVPAILARLADGDVARSAAAADVIGYDLSTGRFRSTAPFIAGSTADFGPPLAAALGVSFNRAFAGRFDQACEIESALTLTALGDLGLMFRDLRGRGLVLGIATNDSESTARRQMTALDIAGALPFIAGYDSGHGAKPAPGMVTAFAAHLGVAANRIAMVGDSTHDLAAGRGAGAVTIAVLTGMQTADDLAPLADHILPSIADLPALLDTLGIERQFP